MLRNALAHAGTRKLRWHALAVALGILVGLPLVAEVYETITIKKGDTLWDLSQAYLGDGYRYKEFLGNNTLVSGDADLIYPGEVLNLPETVGEETPVVGVEAPVIIEIELPVSVVQEMLTDMSARLAQVTTELETIKSQLSDMDDQFVSLEDQVGSQSRSAVPVLNLSSIEDRVDELDDSIADMIEAGSADIAATTASATVEVSALRSEFETLSKSVETHAAIQKRAMEELTVKLTEPDGGFDEAPEVTDRRRVAGLISVLTAGVAFLVVTATR
jgi:LysM repeat protein